MGWDRPCAKGYGALAIRELRAIRESPLRRHWAVLRDLSQCKRKY